MVELTIQKNDIKYKSGCKLKTCNRFIVQKFFISESEH